jgi:hypothetical protein
VGVIFKFHPRLAQEQTAFFKEYLGEHPDIYFMKNGKIEECFSVSDLVVGVYSTALLEAIEAGKEVHIIDCPEADYFDDLITKGNLRRSENLKDSLELLGNNNNFKGAIRVRDPFDAKVLSNLNGMPC